MQQGTYRIAIPWHENWRLVAEDVHSDHRSGEIKPLEVSITTHKHWPKKTHIMMHIKV